jgi:hypothetical protein
VTATSCYDWLGELSAGIPRHRRGVPQNSASWSRQPRTRRPVPSKRVEFGNCQGPARVAQLQDIGISQGPGRTSAITCSAKRLAACTRPESASPRVDGVADVDVSRFKAVSNIRVTVDVPSETTIKAHSEASLAAPRASVVGEPVEVGRGRLDSAIAAGQPANRVFILAGVVRFDILVRQRAQRDPHARTLKNAPPCKTAILDAPTSAVEYVFSSPTCLVPGAVLDGTPGTASTAPIATAT